MSLYSALTQVLAPFAAKIKGIQTGYDGTEYTSPGEAVREQINDLHVLIGDVPGTAIAGSAVSYDGTSSDLSATNVQAAVDETNEKITTVNGRLTQLDGVVDVVYPNHNVVLATLDDFALNNTNVSAELPILQNGHRYRIFVKFSGEPTALTTIRTATGLSGSTIVDDITATFEGDSWTEGKECIYQPSVINIKYLRFGFNSSYAKDLTCDITLYDYDKEMETGFATLETEISKNAERIDKVEYVVDLDRDYNLLPPDGYTVGKTITSAGVIANHSTYVLSDYIPINPAQEYICNWAKTASIVPGNSGMTGSVDCFIRYYFCFFDANKNVVPFTGDGNAPSKAIPENAAYIRVCTKSEEAYKIARLIYGNYSSQPVIRLVDYKKTQQSIYDSPNTGFEGFKMVMFGDSITHGSLTTGNDGVSYVDYANDVLRSNILNVGFGGTRMTYSLTGAGLFCFYHLCECITSNDTTLWDDLVTYATNDNTSYLPHLQKLMAVDWAKVKAIGLMYGANDYASNTPVGNAYSEDTTKFDGACAYGLKLLLTKYPHLQVIILTPFDREMTSGNPATMTDVQTNSAGLIMSDYADSLENVQSRFHCPLINTGKLFGINQYNILTYAPDGTHPRANIAQERLGYLFAQAVRTNLCPV